MQGFIRRSLAAALLGLAPIAAAAQAPPPWPSTISPQARAILQQLDANRPAFARPPAKPIDWAAQYRAGEAFLAKLNAPVLQRLRPTVGTLSLGGVNVVKIVPHGASPSPELLIYVHGGGYTMFSANSTVASAAEMAASARLPVYSVDYTVAPRGTWRTAPDQVIAVYRALLAQGHPPHAIGMFGDSAGGGLVAGAVLKLRDEGVPMPGALVLLSPWSDITATGDSYTTLAAADPMLSQAELKTSADVYAPPADQKNPIVSPVYGNYAPGFPPTLIQGGTREIFLSNFVRQYRAIVDAGGYAQLDLYEAMPHVFQTVLYGTPESVAAFRVIGRFWRDHLRPS
jgi:acetyl esterase/lipase